MTKIAELTTAATKSHDEAILAVAAWKTETDAAKKAELKATATAAVDTAKADAEAVKLAKAAEAVAAEEPAVAAVPSKDKPATDETAATKAGEDDLDAEAIKKAEADLAAAKADADAAAVAAVAAAAEVEKPVRASTPGILVKAGKVTVTNLELARESAKAASAAEGQPVQASTPSRVPSAFSLSSKKAGATATPSAVVVAEGKYVKGSLAQANVFSRNAAAPAEKK